MKKLSGFLSLLCVLNVLAIVGLLGYLLGTGRLDKDKAQTITDILRAPATPAHLRTDVYELMNAASTTQPTATAAASTKANSTDRADIPATADERNQYVRKAIELERLQQEAQAQELRNQQEMLTRVQNELMTSAEKLEQKKKAFEEQLATSGKKNNEAALKRTLAVMDELKPQQIKDLLVPMKDPEIVEYFNAMDPERTAKILAAFKTDEEKKTVARVVALMGGTPSDFGTGAASGNPAALSASAAPPVKAGP